jgi:phage shock protein C
MDHSFADIRPPARIMGVCARLSARTGIDVFAIRVTAVLLTLCALGPVGVVAYLLAGGLAD